MGNALWTFLVRGQPVLLRSFVFLCAGGTIKKVQKTFASSWATLVEPGTGHQEELVLYRQGTDSAVEGRPQSGTVLFSVEGTI